MASFLQRISGRNIFMPGMGIVLLWLLYRNPNAPITYRYSTEPLPHQRFARAVFYVAGIVLVLGDLWGLWTDYHAVP